MGIFGKKAAPPQPAAPAPAKAAPPRLTSAEKSRLDGYPKLQKKLESLEKRLQFQEQEIQEQEQYLRSTLDHLNQFRKQARFQEGEIAEQETYLRTVAEHLSALQGQKEYQNLELKEMDAYIRQLLQTANDLKKREVFQENELKDYDAHLRQVMEGFSKVQQQKQFQEQEIRELEAYLRNVTEGFQQLQKTHSDQERENQRLAQELLSRQEAFEQDQHRYQSERSDWDAGRQALENQLRELKEQQANLERSMEAKREENGALRRDLVAKEQALQEYQKGMHHPIPLLELNQEGIIIAANEAFERLTGYTETELLGKHERLTLQFKEEDALRYSNLWSRVAAGFPQQDTFTLYTRHGKEIHVDTEYVPGPGRSNGSITKWIRETANQNKLQESLRALTEGVNDLLPIMHMDLSGKITLVNQRMQDVLGLSEQGLLGRRFHDLLTDEERQSAGMLHLFDFLQSGEAIHQRFRFQGQHTQPVSLQVSMQPVLDLRQHALEVILVGRSLLTPQKMASDPVATLTQDLRALREGRKLAHASSNSIPPQALVALHQELTHYLDRLHDQEKPTEQLVNNNLQDQRSSVSTVRSSRYLQEETPTQKTRRPSHANEDFPGY